MSTKINFLYVKNKTLLNYTLIRSSIVHPQETWRKTNNQLEKVKTISVFKNIWQLGYIHGDLHLGNILVDKNQFKSINIYYNIMNIANDDSISFLKTIENESVNLILTDPPYIISKESGMNSHFNTIESNRKNNIKFVKTEEEWKVYKQTNNISNDDKKSNFLKFGTIYGTKYGTKTDYGDWDKTFTLEVLDEIVHEYYKKLKAGGTLIMFFDIWKIGELKTIFEKHKFKQIRFIEWIKTNPQPINSKINYLSNAREVALVGIKKSKPTFNSSYDNGIYQFPIASRNRTHPTQKNLELFESLIEKHSNENDIVLDTFLGSGTTAFACKNKNRVCKGCEISKEYYDIIKKSTEHF